MSSSYLHRRRIALIAVAVLSVWTAALGVAQGSEEQASDDTSRILLAGGAKVLWAVRTAQGSDGDKFDLLIRRPGGKWRKLSRFQGDPSAIVPGAGSLHVVASGADPSITVFSLSSGKEMTLDSMAPGGKWPSRNPPSAMSPISALGKSSRDGFIAAVAHESDRLSTTTATSRPAVKNSGLTILQTVEGKWETLCELRDIPGAVGARVSITSAENWVYILIVAKEHPARMLAWNTSDNKGRWIDADLPPEPHQPLSLQTLKNRAVLVTIAQKPWGPPSRAGGVDPDSSGMRLAIHELEAGKIAAKPQPITYQGSPLVITDQSPPLTCSLGKPDESQLVLLWRQGETYRCAMADINGQIAENKEVKALTRAVSEFDAWSVVGYLLWAIPPIMLLLILMSQKDRPLVTLPLPARFIPSAFIKRLAALLIDWLPISFIVSIALTIARPDLIMTFDDMKEMFFEQQPQAMPPELVMGMVVSFLVWMAYGSIMEFKFGATLGKKALRLEVVSLDGKRPSIFQAIMRNLIRPIEIIVLPILMISVSLSFLTRAHQRLGDLIARTVVVEKTRRIVPQSPDIIDIDPQDPPTDA